MARPTKTHDNEAVMFYLCDYLTFKRFMEDESIPESMKNAIDDILTGVSRLDHGGNTRPLSASKLYTMLSSMPHITTQAVQEAAGQSERHAQRLALALRIASTAIQNAMIKTGEAGMFDMNEDDCV
ncbi:hypothetical protein B0T49_21885 [Chromobacterium violaceum]|uniref:hypothetical protein n=1 Tax=Chromobacterium violaceum TaxID=536 RepID=UPI0009D984A4|nr:hypothetical protein [Chromobacterium violaceum]OQS45091.1 hypothetical protein B0T49_21885 [Chromobacterium violaceum]OQS49492.1 hypothetical protein B0T48_05505 [Chromobacterium violaceum]